MHAMEKHPMPTTLSGYIIQSLPQKWSILLWPFVWAWILIDIPTSIKAELSAVAGVAVVLLVCESLYATKVSLGKGRVQDSVLPLSEGEELKDTTHALLARGIGHIPGRLSRTHERLVFQPLDDSRADDIITIDTHSIASVEQTHVRLFGIIPLGRLSMRISTQSGESFNLSMHQPTRWVNALSH